MCNLKEIAVKRLQKEAGEEINKEFKALCYNVPDHMERYVEVLKEAVLAQMCCFCKESNTFAAKVLLCQKTFLEVLAEFINGLTKKEAKTGVSDVYAYSKIAALYCNAAEVKAAITLTISDDVDVSSITPEMIKGVQEEIQGRKLAAKEKVETAKKEATEKAALVKATLPAAKAEPEPEKKDIQLSLF